MSVIIERPPYPGGSALQRMNNFAYLQAARASLKILGRSDDVRSIFVRRSLAAGEVYPPFSDIDFSVLLKSPMDGKDGPDRLLRLYDTFRLLRLALPILGEGEISTPEEFAWCGRVDQYRYSLNARVGILVYGDPIEAEDVPVSPHAAIRRFVFWFEHFISQAIRTSNRRNLRKFALEFWNARACATGRIDRPFITRRESEVDWRAAPDSEQPPQGFGRDLRATAVACFEQAKKLHDEVMAPLAPLSAPVVYADLLWPVAEHRCFVVLPDARSDWPGEVARPDSLVCTPEVLDLYIHFCNPLKFWTLPEELRALGIAEPSFEDYAEGCRYSLEPHRSREPGFSCRDVKVFTRFWTINQVVSQLKAGAMPRPPDRDEMLRRRNTRMNAKTYFREAYTETYGLGAEARGWLDSMQ